MAWVGVGTSVVSIGLGVLGGKKKAKQAKEARAQEQANIDREFGLAEDQFNWSKDIYEEDKARYDPIFDEMRESMDDVQPDYEKIAGDIGSSFDSAQGMERRQQRRFGVKPTDGATAASEREYGIKRGAAHVGARSAARAGAKDKKYARRADMFNASKGINSQNAQGVQAAMANQQGAARNAANVSGRNARQFDRDSAADSAGWGQAVGSLDWGGIFNEVKGWGSGGDSTGGSSRSRGI